jgi:YD repeat-containing protein
MVHYTYDEYGNKISGTDARGNITTYTYDDNNNLLSVKNALNNITTYTYNSLQVLAAEHIPKHGMLAIVGLVQTQNHYIIQKVN